MPESRQQAGFFHGWQTVKIAEQWWIMSVSLVYVPLAPPVPETSDSGELGPELPEERLQHRAVAACFYFAVAAH